MQSRNVRTVKFVFAALAAAGLGALTASRFASPPAQPQSGTLLAEPRPVAPFTLTDQDARPFTNAALEGHWTLLFAGFTHCPDVCPTTLALMKQLHQRPELGGRVQYLFLSVDPERDTPAQLKTYV